MIPGVVQKNNNTDMGKLRLTFFIFILFSLFLPEGFAQVPVLAAATPASAKVSGKRLDRIDNVLKQYIDSGWIKGAVGFIARDGKVIYNKAFGMDDAENNRPMRTDVIFRIASQTKAITSVAVMILFEEGKFLLDDPISKYIPEFARPNVIEKFNPADSSFSTLPARREITIRDLLTHTSGLGYPSIGTPEMRAIYYKHRIPVGFVTDKLTLGNEMKRLATLPLQHQPGEKFTYGLNTDLLGYLVEKVSGMNLAQFFQQRIFTPLGMNDTYFYLPETKYARLATLYAEDKEKRAVKYNTPPAAVSADYPKQNGTYYSGGAGLNGTIHDYAIFLQMLLNGGIYNGQRILSRRTVELMTCNQIGDLFVGGVDKFGLGFQVTTERGQARTAVSEGSFSWAGYFGTTFWVDPKEGLVCLLYMQQSPISHNDIQNKFKVLVYQAVE
jgi:CubicO group peptidase (beta-lactamase class C family)